MKKCNDWASGTRERHSRAALANAKPKFSLDSYVSFSHQKAESALKKQK